MKWIYTHLDSIHKRSPSMRRVWIEICTAISSCSAFMSPSMRRVWIEIAQPLQKTTGRMSPSMRRVWIEMAILHGKDCAEASHPPCGGCGLKLHTSRPCVGWAASPSMRRVWIEMGSEPGASRKRPGHPPCGGCGLKSKCYATFNLVARHPPCGGCGLKLRSVRLQLRQRCVTLHAEGVD